MKISTKIFAFNLWKLSLICLLSSCSINHGLDEVEPILKSSRQTGSLNWDEAPTEVSPIDKEGETLVNSNIPINDIFSFSENGLLATLVKTGKSGNEAILRVENKTNTFTENTHWITISIEFWMPINDNVEFFQVTSGIDSISRSVEYNSTIFLTEFYLNEEITPSEMIGLAFGVYFRRSNGAPLPGLHSIIKEISIFPGNIETVILDDSFICNKCGAGGIGARVGPSAIPWDEIMTAICLYRIGTPLDEILQSVQENLIIMKEGFQTGYNPPQNTSKN